MTTSKTPKNTPKNGSASSPSPKPVKPAKPPKPSENKVAKSLETAYTGAYAYDSSANRWRHFKDGVWEPINDIKICETIRRSIDEHFSPDFSFNFVTGVTKLLRGMMAYDSWDNAVSPSLIPFPNGVLNLETMQFTVGHDPANCFTWQLPYEYNPNATCGPVLTWLKEAAGGDESVVQIIRAFFNATLTGRSDLQRFLEIDGEAGSGKGTLTRLFNSLIGENNVYTTTLKQLEENRFETASIYGKRLVQISDADVKNFGGVPNVLKAITGQDLIRYERKNQQQGDGFFYGGMVLIVANGTVRFNEDSNAIYRRRITVRFDKVVPVLERRDLTAEFNEFLPGVLNWCLAMPKEEVERVLKDTERYSLGAADGKLQSILDSHPLANWLKDNVRYSPTGVVKVGKDDSEHANDWLFANYCRYAQQTRIKNVVNLTRFTAQLESLLVTTLGLGEEFRKRRECEGIRGSFFRGLELCENPDVSIMDYAQFRLTQPTQPTSVVKEVVLPISQPKPPMVVAQPQPLTQPNDVTVAWFINAINETLCSINAAPMTDGELKGIFLNSKSSPVAMANSFRDFLYRYPTQLEVAKAHYLR